MSQNDSIDLEKGLNCSHNNLSFNSMTPIKIQSNSIQAVEMQAIKEIHQKTSRLKTQWTIHDASSNMKEGGEKGDKMSKRNKSREVKKLSITPSSADLHSSHSQQLKQNVKKKKYKEDSRPQKKESDKKGDKKGQIRSFRNKDSLKTKSTKSKHDRKG